MKSIISIKSMRQYLFLSIFLISSTVFGQPTLLSPSDGSTAQSITPTFTWESVPGATSYRIQISTNINFDDPNVIYNENIGNTLTHTIPASILDFGLTYYWRVRSFPPLSEYSLPFSFSTISIPSLINPVNNENNVSLLPTFEWTDVGATQYGLEVATNSDFSNIILTQNIAGTSYTVLSALNQGTTYYWRVRVNTPSTTPYSDEFTFTTLIIQPPDLISPTNGSERQSLKPTFEWNAVANAQRYWLQVSTNEGFTSLIHNASVGNVTSYTLATELNPMSTYYWRVRTRVNTIWSAFSTNWSFTTTGLPLLTLPLNNAENISINPVFEWTYTQSSDFFIEISEDNFLTTLHSIPVSGTSYWDELNLENYKTYYWRIKASNPSPGTISEIYNFRTEPVTLLSPGDENQGLSLLPTFQWRTVSGAAGYRIEISENSDFSTTVLSKNVGNVTSYTLLASEILGLNKIYFWRVKTNTSPQYCLPWSFKTVGTPTLISPADGAAGISVNPIFVWSDVGASDYLFEISEDNFGIVSHSANVTGTYYNDVPTLDFTKQYHWRVTVNTTSTTTITSAIFGFITEGMPVLGIPKLVSPINNSIGWGLLPTFEWQRSPSTEVPTSYDIQIFDNPSLINPVFEANVPHTDDNMSYALGVDDSLLLNKKYYWRVRAKNVTVTTPYASAWNFKTTYATIPKPSYPTGGAIIWSTSVNLSWYLNGAFGNLTFEVEWKPAIEPFNEIGVIELDTMQLAISGLSGGTAYHWRVRSVDEQSGTKVYSPWSSSATFTVSTSLVPTTVIPIASWPKNETSVYTTTPKLNWYTNAPSVGLYYQIQIEEDGAGFSFLQETAVNEYTYELTVPLTLGTKYNWRVRSHIDAGTFSDWSDTASFIVYGSTSAPAKPIISWPKENALVYSSETQLNWYLNGPYSGLWYEIQVKPGGIGVLNPDDVDYSVGVGVFHLNINGLLSGTTYSWKVRSVDASNNRSDWSVPASFEVFPGFGIGPPQPITTWPKGGVTIETNSPTLSWYVVGQSSTDLTYRLQISTWPDFSNSTTTIPNIVGNSFTIVGLTSGTNYYWRVKSIDNNNVESNYSLTAEFTTSANNSVVVPKLGSPYGDVIVNTNSPVLSWYLSTSTIQLNYELQVANNPEMNNPMVYSNINSFSKELSNLIPGESYYWRVKSYLNNGTTSEYSIIGGFRIDETTNAENDDSLIPEEFSVNQNYPNPFNPSTKISFSLPEQLFVSIKIYDMLGREIRTLLEEEKQTGNHSVIWNGNDAAGRQVSSGTYIYRVVAGNHSQTMKMLFLK